MPSKSRPPSKEKNNTFPPALPAPQLSHNPFPPNQPASPADDDDRKPATLLTYALRPPAPAEKVAGKVPSLQLQLQPALVDWGVWSRARGRGAGWGGSPGSWDGDGDVLGAFPGVVSGCWFWGW